MATNHTRSAGSILSGTPTGAFGAITRQRRIADALEWRDMTLAELSEAAELEPSVIRAELARMRATGYAVTYDRLSKEYHIAGRPGPRFCTACGARLRRDNDGAICDPCGGSTYTHGGPHSPRRGSSRHYAAITERLLEVLRQRPDERLHLIGLADAITNRQVTRCVARLRSAGHDIEAHGKGFYTYHGNGKETA
jgi:hypothetical protein